MRLSNNPVTFGLPEAFLVLRLIFYIQTEFVVKTRKAIYQLFLFPQPSLQDDRQTVKSDHKE